MFAKSLPISLEMRGRGKRGEGEVCDVQLYALEIRAGYCNEVCVCVCVLSRFFFVNCRWENLVARLLSSALMSRALSIPSPSSESRFLDFIKISRGEDVIVAVAAAL